MNDKPYQFKTFNATYTVNPNSGNIILNFNTSNIDYLIENKLESMTEYKDAKEVLTKFTLHGKN